MEKGKTTYNLKRDKIIILRVNEPNDTPPEGGGFPPPPPPDKVPDNVEDPFDKDKESKDNEGKDENKNNNPEPDKGEGEDNDGKDDKSDGEDENNDNGKTEGGINSPDDEDDNEGKPDDGTNTDDSDDDKGEGEGEGEGEGADSFGDDDEAVDFDELLRKSIEDFDKAKSDTSFVPDTDIVAVEVFLGANTPNIIKTFKTKTLAKIAIGRAQIFEDRNSERINNVLNLIFD